MSSIREYMGRKKAKPEWTPGHPETRVPNSGAGSSEDLSQLNKDRSNVCTILQDNISGLE